MVHDRASIRRRNVLDASRHPINCARNNSIAARPVKLLIIPAILALVLTPALARTFTNLKGQKFEGTLSGADALNAEIERADGRKFKVPLATLTAEDRLYCEEWRVANPAIKLTVKADAVTAPGTRQTTNDSTRGSTSTTSRTRQLEEGYRITVSNWSKDPGAKLCGLTVDYAIVVGFFNTSAKVKRGVKEIVRGSASLPDLNGTNPQSILTQTVTTGQSAAVASSTRTDSNGDSSTAPAAVVYRESMDGICFVVKSGDRVVATFTSGKVPKELPLELLKK